MPEHFTFYRSEASHYYKKGEIQDWILPLIDTLVALQVYYDNNNRFIYVSNVFSGAQRLY